MQKCFHGLFPKLWHIRFSPIQQEVRDILEDTTVVGIDITNGLEALIFLSPERVRVVQTHFNEERCSEPDPKCGELPTLDGSRLKHTQETS